MWHGEFAEAGDQARLVTDSPAMLSFHDGDRLISYVRLDLFGAVVLAAREAVKGKDPLPQLEQVLGALQADQLKLGEDEGNGD